MGYALGCMGMSRADFCACTPLEFKAASEQHRQHYERIEHAAWERMRLSAALCVQPHVKNRINPKSLIPLPWDNQRPPAQRNSTADRLSALMKRRKVTEKL